MRTGTADLPLHGGRAPRWLFERMSLLARELRYGALPLSFKAESAQHVSASLGTAQLKASFIAGGIGLVLVILYSLL